MPLELPVVTPRSLAEAYALLASAPHRPIAGGTDLMVQLAADAGEPPERVLDLWRLDELRGISVADGSSTAPGPPDSRSELVIGALTTHAQLRASPLVRTHLPALAEAAATVGAAQIQNRGTLGGNVCNASPAGDTLPVLLASDARFELGGARGTRIVEAAAFWISYRQIACAPDELLLRVRVPLVDGRRMRFRKVGTRRAQAISKVVLACAWREEAGCWRDVRVAIGSVAPVPIRARETEAALEGTTLIPATAERAAAALAAEVTPIDDVRSTAEYRRAVSGRVLHRLLREVGGW